MSRLPSRPSLQWRDHGAPIQSGVDDIYFADEGLSEKRVVFLAGCGLPERWAARDCFTIGELGFGAGLSFLAAWDLWRTHRPHPAARLDFLSFENALMTAEEAQKAVAAWPELAGLAQTLAAHWPENAFGVQRIALPDGVSLTLHIGDIADTLPQTEARVDAWFLDGFSPARNPDMWNETIMTGLARLSAPGARAAAYSVAGLVRRSLEAAGFAVSRRPGHGRKKERLEAVLAPALANFPAPVRSSPRRVIVVGAGIAGCMAAHAFAARGAEVEVIDAGDGPGAGASGNPLALVMPRFDNDDGPAARALVTAWLAARRRYGDMPSDIAIRLDVRQAARNDADRKRYSRLLADPPLDASLLAPLDPADPGAGLLHRGGMALRPGRMLPHLLADARLRTGSRVALMFPGDAPAVVLASGERLDADLVILATAMELASADLPLTGRLGQVEHAALPGQPDRADASGHYAVAAGGELVFGATFEPAPEGPPKTDPAARASNLAALAQLRPDLVPPPDDSMLASRAAIRATTPDRLPFAGWSPDGQAGVMVIGGLGSRGFLWAPMLADLLAHLATGEPLAMERRVADILSPGRFAERRKRREAGQPPAGT